SPADRPLPSRRPRAHVNTTGATAYGTSAVVRRRGKTGTGDAEMAEQTGTRDILPDPNELAKNFTRIAEQSQRIMSEFLARNAREARFGPDPYGVGRAFMELTAQMMA